MATRTTVSVNGDGVQTILMEQIEASDKPKGGDGGSIIEGEPHLTRAQRRLQKLREGAQSESVRRVDVDGDDEPYFVKAGNFADMTLAAALSGRDANNVLALFEPDKWTGFVAAMLRVFVVNGERDLGRYFESKEDALQFSSDPATVNATMMLFYAIVDMNEAVFPEGAATAKKAWALLVEAKATTSLLPPLKVREEN